MTDDTTDPESGSGRPRADETPATTSTAGGDPVRRATLIVLVLCVLLIVFYLFADRATPFSSQARIHAQVVPIASEVSGTVAEVLVRDNQLVAAGEVLFRIDPIRYELAVANAEAALQAAREGTEATTTGLDAAQANVLAARASLARSRQDADRLRRIKQQDAGAISDRLLESSIASVEISTQKLAAAEAQLEQARQALGQSGDENASIAQALASLERARIDLARTSVRAPFAGLVTEVRLERGNFAAAGAPQMTFIGTEDVWVRADFTENNLGRVDVGDPAELIFDVYPGRVFSGRVRGIGFGVAVDNAPLGSLPTISNNRQWLRSAQRFPVVIEFDMPREDLARLRIGSQASAVIYTDDGVFLNWLAELYVRVLTRLSYAY
ncbi:MAG: HlyD family secretion protein [Pseudomonadales bacterium]|jgi:multidrug resistance efflux pump|nr:HlyD family secretion protein [Pseudomonadales bacterium]